MSKIKKEEDTSAQDKEQPDSSFVVSEILSTYSRDLQAADHVEIPATRKSDKEYLHTAIGMLHEFFEGFSTITPEEFNISPEEIADTSAEMKRYRIKLLHRKNKETDEILKERPAELFSRQCDKARRIDPSISQIKVASKEWARTRRMLEELEALPLMEHFYLGHPIYEMITDPETGYLRHLNDILGQKQPEGSADFGFKKLPSDYSEERIRIIFDKLVYKGISKKKSKDNFVALFKFPEQQHKNNSPGPSDRIVWNGRVRGAKVLLYAMMHRIAGVVLTAATLKSLFDCNYTINDNQYQRDTENNSYPSSKHCDDIFSGA